MTHLDMELGCMWKEGWNLVEIRILLEIQIFVQAEKVSADFVLNCEMKLGQSLDLV